MKHPPFRILEVSKGLWQVYKLLDINSDGTAEYLRQPDYKSTGTIQWFKSRKAAKEWAEPNV